MTANENIERYFYNYFIIIESQNSRKEINLSKEQRESITVLINLYIMQAG